MQEPIKTIIEAGGLHAFLGVMGGSAKVALGLSPNESLCKEIIRVIFIAMPFGWMGGGLAEEAGLSQYTIFSVAVVTGLISHNIAKAIMDLGIKEVFTLITGRGGNR